MANRFSCRVGAESGEDPFFTFFLRDFDDTILSTHAFISSFSFQKKKVRLPPDFSLLILFPFESSFSCKGGTGQREKINGESTLPRGWVSKEAIERRLIRG